MTYQEIKERLDKCETILSQLKDSNNPSASKQKIAAVKKKVEVLRESLLKKALSSKLQILTEAEMGTVTTDDAGEAEKLSKKGVPVQLTSEQEGIEFSVEETKIIATEVGKALIDALREVGDEIESVKGRNIEPNSFEIFVKYKDGFEDEFSFLISNNELHLVDFNVDKVIGEIGVKPSGEPIVHKDVIQNNLVKHFQSLNEEDVKEELNDRQKYLLLFDMYKSEKDENRKNRIKKALLKQADKYGIKLQLKEAPEGMYYIKVAIRDARKAINILDDKYYKEVIYSGSDTYYFNSQDTAFDVLQDFGANDIEVTDTNLDLFAEGATYAGRPVKLHKHDPKDRTTWEVEFLKTGKKVPYAMAIANLKTESQEEDDYGRTGMEPRTFVDPKDLTVSARAEKLLNKEDVDIGHQDDEPDMLKQYAYDIATYAAKLYKQLDKYDKMDAEVDFPNWWQSKVILAKDYVAKAQHYLEFEEKQPAIDALALQENVDKVAGGIPYKVKGSKAIITEPLDDSTKERIIARAEKHGYHAQPNMAGGITITLKKATYEAKVEVDDKTEFKLDLKHLLDKHVIEATKEEEDEFHRELDKLVHKTFGHSSDEMKKQVNEYNVNPEAEKYVNKFIEGVSKKYGYDEMDAVHLIYRVLANTGYLDMRLEESNVVKEEKATCCGKCGRVHVKGTKCKRPFLTGKDHCRNN